MKKFKYVLKGVLMNLIGFSLLSVGFLQIIISIIVFIEGFIKKNFNSISFINSIHLFSMGLWAIGMNGFLFNSEPFKWAQFLYFWAIIAAISLGLFGFLFRFKKLQANQVKLVWGLFLLLSITFFYLIFFTNNVISGVYLIDGVRSVLQEKFYYIFFITLFLFSFSGFLFLLYKFKELDTVLRKKVELIFLGSLPVVLVGGIFNMILPTFFNDFSFAWVGPLLLPFSAFSITYSIRTYRFLDISLSFQRILTEFSHVLVYVIPVFIFKDIFLDFPFLLLCIPLLVFLFKKHTFGLFNRFWNYFFFGRSTNYIEELKKASSIFKSSVKEGLQQISNILRTNDARLAFVGDESLKNINNYFRNSSADDLIIDELDYLETSNVSTNSLTKIKKEMGSAMIAVAIPVRDANKNLIGLFLLEKKIDGKLFSEQEIESVKKVVNDTAFYIAHENEYKNSLNSDINKNTLFSSVESFNGLMHEIRHPLMIAQNMKELVDWKKIVPQDQTFIQDSEEALTEMTHKLDAMSDAFQWEHGLIDIQPSYLDLKSFFDLVLKDFQTTDVTLNWKSNIQKNLVSLDVYNLKWAVSEILKNACFFNKENPLIDISIYRENEMISFDFKDNGIGILNKNLENVFDLLFVESFSRNRSECGIGVGLTKVRGIIKKHKGTIAIIDSSKEDGTLVRIQLPFLALN